MNNPDPDNCQLIARLLQQALSVKFASDYYRKAYEPDAKEVFVVEKVGEHYKVHAGADYDGRLSMEAFLSPLGEQTVLQTCIKFANGDDYKLSTREMQGLDSMIVEGLERTFPEVFASRMLSH